MPPCRLYGACYSATNQNSWRKNVADTTWQLLCLVQPRSRCCTRAIPTTLDPRLYLSITTVDFIFRFIFVRAFLAFCFSFSLVCPCLEAFFLRFSQRVAFLKQTGIRSDFLCQFRLVCRFYKGDSSFLRWSLVTFLVVQMILFSLRLRTVRFVLPKFRGDIAEV